MLTYHPIRDPSHCAFRLLCLMSDISDDEVFWDKLRILDFYILFPHLISKISLPKDMVKYKSKLKYVSKSYENLQTASQLMFELTKIQEQAIKSLVAKDIAMKEPFQSGKVKIQFSILPKRIHKIIIKAKFRKEFWYSFLIEQLSEIPLKGSKGLKERTGLMEYRYDAP